LARYTPESRERVREAVDFAQVVGARTELRPAGPQRMQGLCPFHEERTPSFGINPAEKLYYCFGCGAGGDVFRFVMETEALDFPAAMEALAERFGIELERESEDPGAAARRERYDRLYALLERTAAYYVRVLWESDEAAEARSYLLGRGLSEGVLRQFRVGFSPPGWDRVVGASGRSGYTDTELLAAGLASRSRDGRLIDRFRGRIMFPLADVRGRVMGFGARALAAGDQPKYLNSSDSEIFHKGRFVYGGDVARAVAARAGRTVLVEGYTDVLALHQAGVGEAVAVMGTSLTDRQAAELRKLAPTVVMCLDADTAGQEAMMRAAGILSGSGVEIRVAPLPPGADPAEVIARDGVEAVSSALSAAVPLARFEVDHALGSEDLSSAEGQDRVLAKAGPIVMSLPAGALREQLVQHLGSRLNLRSEVLEDALRQAGRAAARTSERPMSRPAQRSNGSPNLSSRREDTERAFLALCVALPEEGEKRLAAVEFDEWFSSGLVRRAAEHLRGRLSTPAAELPEDDEPLARLIAELVIRAGQLEASAAALELEALQLDLARLDRRISTARSEGTEVIALAKEREKVQDAIRHRMQ
jgi:DNA primase